MVQAPAREGPRSELKIQLEEAAVPAMHEFCQQRLSPDPHSQDPSRPAYQVESVYLDTPALDSLDTDDFPKYRVRRYDGVADVLFLEEKFSHRPEVWKRRQRCTAEDITRVLDPATDGAGDTAWFHQRVRTLGLSPRLAVSYRRFAFQTPDLRVTFDDRIRVAVVSGPLDFLALGAGEALDIDCVLELKFSGPPPALADEILARVPAPTPFSKYCRGMRREDRG